MQPERHLEARLGDENAPADHVRDKEDDEIGRQVVGAVPVQLAAASPAALRTLRKRGNSRPLPQAGQAPASPRRTASGHATRAATPPEAAMPCPLQRRAGASI